MPRRLAWAFAPVLALVLAAPAFAGTPDTCKQNLAAAFAGMDATGARLKSARLGDESCTAYRRHFLEVVKVRAVTAMCKSGPERDQDLGKLDSTVENINTLIAVRCGS